MRDGGFPLGSAQTCRVGHLQEKQKASERHIEELSEKVQSLELEKKQLQAALEKASLAAKVRAALTQK